MTVPVYTEHADALFDADKPILGSTHLEARDNLQSAMGGGSDAPRLALGALHRLTAGTDGPVSDPGNIFLSSGTAGIEIVYTYGFVQSGTITVQIERGAGAQQVRVSRVRANVTSIVIAATSSDIDADIDVLSGDEVHLEAGRAGGIGADANYTCRIRVGAGSSLFPRVTATPLSGNDV